MECNFEIETAAVGTHDLTIEELDAVTGGNITVVADKDYFGIEISVGKYSVGVWFTQGSVCGGVSTPSGNHSGCVPS